MLSDPSSNADCVEESPRRQSAESSDRLPLFCDDKETKRIVEENQCPEYRAAESSDGNRVDVVSRDTSGATGSATKRGMTRLGGAVPKDAQIRRIASSKQRQQDDQDDKNYPKPRKVPSMKATHRAKTNKAYDLRYEYTRKGATIPSTMIDHMDNYNKPLFLRFWKGNRCFEYANDRVQPLIKQEMKRRRSSGINYKTTKAPRREYRDSYAKRRRASSGSPSTDRTTSKGTGYSTRASSSSPTNREFSTAGGSPSSSRGSSGGGQTSPQAIGTGCTPFKESIPSSSRTTGKGSSPKSLKTSKPLKTNNAAEASSKSIYMPVRW